MWWKKITENHLSQILSKINNAKYREDPIDRCRDLFDALNKTWQQYGLLSNLQTFTKNSPEIIKTVSIFIPFANTNTVY
jgi:hypothetical protein